MKTHLERLGKLSEGLTPVLLAMQDMDVDACTYGDFLLKEKGFGESISLHIPVSNFIAMYYYPASPYYMDKTLLKRCSLIIDVLIKNLHEDGTADLFETNFHDATVVGFFLTPLAYVYRLIEKKGTVSKEEKLLKGKLYLLFELGAKGIVGGGFHTPNHRWVLAAALALMGNILEDNKYIEEAKKYVAEGIDCDEEGEYTEHSVAIYDITVNESLIVMAKELDMPELYAYVVKNLEKNFTYFEADGTICTLNSRRQDYSTNYFPLRHYWSYVAMAHHLNKATFAGIAEYLLDLMESMAHKLSEYLFTGGKEDIHQPLVQYLLQDYLQEEIEKAELVWEGAWYYPRNGVFRQRKGKTSLTLVRNQEVFLKYAQGKSILMMKLGTCFFGNGYFKPDTIEEIEKGYRLTAHLSCGYKRPLKGVEPSADWFALPHKEREQVHVQSQDIVVEVCTQNGETVIEIKVEGVSHVPLKLEWLLSPEGILTNDTIRMTGKAGSNILLKADGVAYDLEGETIRISGGTATHYYTEAMRGTTPASYKHFTIYMTGETPFNHKIIISS